MKKILALILSLAMMTVGMSFPTSAKEAEGVLCAVKLQTEYLTDPIGIDEAKPRLSWKIESNLRGVTQSAYEVIVSKDEDNIKKGTGDVWDSGKVDSAESNNVVCEGEALENKTAYYWAVRVWDNYGNASDYSETSVFETAFLNGTKWEAEWITADENTYPCVQVDFSETVSARYVRLNAVKLGERVDGWGESGYRLQLAEMQVTDASTGENVALNKTVTSAQAFTNATWNPKYLTDGIISSDTSAQGFTSQMYSSKDTNVVVTVDLGDTYNINGVTLYPRNDVNSVNPPFVPSFPQSYAIEYSADNVNFATAFEAENSTIPSYSDNEGLPVFGKSFTTKDKKIESARVYASGLGLFEMYVNGEKATDAVLEPGETNFDKKAFYVTYDITDKIVCGENAVGVYMGKGFYYNPSVSGRYNRSPKIWGPLMFTSQIEIVYSDGEKDTVMTDGSWRYTYGPVRECVWLGGEDYDANYEIENFATAECDMSTWGKCITVPESDYPFETLEAKMYPSIKPVAEVKPESVTEITNSDGTKSYVVKFERNFAGLYTFTADLPKGTTVTFRPAEHIKADGTVNQSSTVMWGSSGTIYDTYTSAGNGEYTYMPKFVYHGAQYLQIEGMPYAVTDDMITGYVLRCDNEEAGSISSSDGNVTKLHEMITNSISDNMFNVITDCPHREKLGWLEVPNLLYNSIADNFNIAAYMEKISDDMIEAQKENGSVPSIVPPLTVGKSEHALRNNSDDDTPNDPTWCGAEIMVPWYSYTTYGNMSQLKKAWPSMQKYFDYLTSMAVKSNTEYILESGDLNRDLGDWMSLESTSVTFVVTCTYYSLAKTMAQTAEVIGKDAGKYENTAENIKNAINEKFFDEGAASYDTGSQTANALPLYLGLVPEGYETRVAKNLADKVADNSYHLSSGEVGLRAVFDELSEYGYSDYAYKMIMNETAPSYYYFVSQGKTTLPEEWNGGASQDHCMAGHGEGWLYEYLGGIRNGSVAYKDIIIDPYIEESLDFYEARIKCIYGEIISKWSKENGTTVMEVTIPANTTAKIYFPVKSAVGVTEGSLPLEEAEGVLSVSSENGKATALVGSGSYRFTMPTKKLFRPASVKANPIVTAFGGENAEYAVDGDEATVFTIENQTEDTIANQYIAFEFKENEKVNKIVIKRQLIDNSYWQDHSLAVGCEIQGSNDNSNWETVYEMNPAPDGTDSQNSVVVSVGESYRYFRYIRTYVKKSGDYAYWKWSSTDGGNRINIAEIEFYKTSEEVYAEIEKRDEYNALVRVQSGTDGKYNMITAIYSPDRTLLRVVSTPVELKANEEEEFVINTEEGDVEVFFWNDTLSPVSEKAKF
jgi:alpha-L-rhamnosidase